MKKIYVLMAIFAATALTSCVEHELPYEGDETIGENDIVFAISRTVTKAETASSLKKGAVIPLGKDNDGTAFTLEETIVNLDDMGPVTKGTPAYTGNLGKVFKDNLSAIGKLNNVIKFPESTFSSMDEEMVNDRWRYRHVGNTGYWPDEDTKLDFYLRMPATSTAVTNYTTKDGKIEFDYTSPESGEAQTDILFAHRKLSKSEHAGYMPDGAPVLFRHALTGVKFTTANHISGAAQGTKTYITKVEFKGLTSNGHCTFDPSKSTETTDDDTAEFSSQKTMKWGPATTPKTGNFSQEFDPAEHFKSNPYSGHYDYETEGATNDGYFPDSFYAEDKVSGIEGKRSTDWNINDADGSLTFWFIPQTITKDVELEVTFHIQAGDRRGDDIVRTIKFGEINEGVEWKAGQLRTYVLKATEIAVVIEDEMSSETLKKMVQVRNMGNVPEWVRATVVANWCVYRDAAGNIISNEAYASLSDAEKEQLESVAVYGYSAATGETFVEPWDLDIEIGSNPKYGTFYKQGVPGVEGTTATQGFPGNNWFKHTDGYYYYAKYIGVDQAATEQLFTAYEVGDAPTMYLLDRTTWARTQVDVHLEMDVVVQAILANVTEVVDENGNYVEPEPDQAACLAAWAQAR